MSLASGPGSSLSRLCPVGPDPHCDDLGSFFGKACVVFESGPLSKNVSLFPGVRGIEWYFFVIARKTLMKNEPSVKLISKIYSFSVTNKPTPVHLTPLNSSPSPPPTF